MITPQKETPPTPNGLRLRALCHVPFVAGWLCCLTAQSDLAGCRVPSAARHAGRASTESVASPPTMDGTRPVARVRLCQWKKILRPAQHNVIRVRLDDLRDTSRSTRNLGHAMCAGTAHPAPYQIYSLQELVLTPLHVTRRTPSEIDLVPLRFSL